VDELGTGSQSRVTSVLAFALAGYALYWAVAYVETHSYRITFLLLVLLITFLSGRSEGPTYGREHSADQKDARYHRDYAV
jgi:hypothetical protein